MIQSIENKQGTSGELEIHVHLYIHVHLHHIFIM